jgi:diguanylate cyclase (GGDEF)-like protein/PAS domain S-box-containing protein
MGASWYIVLILPAFFLGGIKTGAIATAASVLSILILKITAEEQYSAFSFLYTIMPLIITAIFVLLYELRNNKARKLLKEKNEYLEHKVELKTQEIKELADMVSKSNIELYIVDFHTDHYLYVNQGGLNALGYTLQEMMQMSVYDINPALTVEMVTKMKELSKTTPNIMNIAQHQRKDGSVYGVQSFIHPITYHSKEAYVIYDINLTDQQKAHDELLRQKEVLLTHAYYDTLTKLPNRVLFHDRLSQAMAKSKRSQKELALLFIDLDHFKEINDSLGHDVGDKVLVQVASRFQNVLRAEDTISRLGGDEFTVIIENLESKESASMLAQKLIDSAQKAIVVDNYKLFVTCSIGISIYPKDAYEGETLINNADNAMYMAKKDGKNRFKFFKA